MMPASTASRLTVLSQHCPACFGLRPRAPAKVAMAAFRLNPLLPLSAEAKLSAVTRARLGSMSGGGPRLSFLSERAPLRYLRSVDSATPRWTNGAMYALSAFAAGSNRLRLAHLATASDMMWCSADPAVIVARLFLATCFPKQSQPQGRSAWATNQVRCVACVHTVCVGVASFRSLRRSSCSAFASALGFKVRPPFAPLIWTRLRGRPLFDVVARYDLIKVWTLVGVGAVRPMAIGLSIQKECPKNSTVECWKLLLTTSRPLGKIPVVS